MYGTVAAAEIKPKLKSGDRVRFSKLDEHLKKGIYLIGRKKYLPFLTH